MSHTTKIQAVQITDTDALTLAVRDLKAAGIKCVLQANATPRAYYKDQKGMGKAAYVLALENSRYDVGFYKAKDKEIYEARADLFGGDIAKILGAPAKDGESHEQAALGRLFQAYAVNATMRAAVRKGYAVSKSVKADGSIQLTMNV